MRIRTVKPEWLEDERLAAASDEARVLSVALILMADDHGRGRASMAAIAAGAWRYQMERNDGRDAPEILARASRAFRELLAIEFVTVYEVNGQRYFEIRNWKKHQKVDRPSKPLVPPPNVAESFDSRDTRETLARHSRDTRKILAPDHDLDHDLDQDHDHAKGAVVIVVEPDPADPKTIYPTPPPKVTGHDVLVAFESEWMGVTTTSLNLLGKGKDYHKRADAVAAMAIRDYPSDPLAAVHASAFGFTKTKWREFRAGKIRYPFLVWAAVDHLSEYFLTESEAARA